MKFRDRKEAGLKLAELLKQECDKDCIVLGIPRGGVILSYEISKKLNIPSDIIIPRKVGAPYNPEVAIGAVTQDGTLISDKRVIQMFNISEEELEEEALLVKEEINRRMKRFRGNKPFPNLTGKNVILVDDGIATGFTVKAAIKSIQNQNPKKLILAVPVAPRDILQTLEAEVDKIICPLVPEDFYAVGQYYESFEQTTDQEVKESIKTPL